MKICCICGKSFKGCGNNPAPVEINGVCCDACNAYVVLPRRLFDTKREQTQAAADALTSTPLQPAESKKINALVGKLVEVEFCNTYDGDVEVGILHKDTLATRYQNPDGDNKTLCGYWLDRVDGALHFKKSHVKNICVVDTTQNEQLTALVGKSVIAEFNNGETAAGVLYKEIKQTVYGAQIAYYYIVTELTKNYIETSFLRMGFYCTDVKTIREA